MDRLHRKDANYIVRSWTAKNTNVYTRTMYPPFKSGTILRWYKQNQSNVPRSRGIKKLWSCPCHNCVCADFFTVPLSQVVALNPTCDKKRRFAKLYHRTSSIQTINWCCDVSNLSFPMPDRYSLNKRVDLQVMLTGSHKSIYLSW